MGLQKKNQPEESAGKKWVIAGIAIRAPLKSIRTKPKAEYACEEGEGEGFSPRTPTARESRISEHLPCPPAPRKPRPVQQTCRFDGAEVESFSIQDLESMFVPVPIRRHV